VLFFKEKWNELTPVAKILTALLLGVLMVVAGHYLFINRLMRKNRKITANFVDKLGGGNIGGEKYLSAAEKEIRELEKQLNNAGTGGYSPELLRKDGGVRIIAGIDSLTEKCGLQIVRRDGVVQEADASDVIDSKSQKGDVSGGKKGLASVGFLSCSYSTEGSFRSVYRFFSALNDIKEPFYIVGISLNRRGLKQEGNSIVFNFKLKIPYLKK